MITIKSDSKTYFDYFNIKLNNIKIEFKKLYGAT